MAPWNNHRQEVKQEAAAPSSMTMKQMAVSMTQQAKVLPLAYAAWWSKLLRESPEHVFVETLLIVFLVWVVWAGRKQRARLTKNAVTPSARG